MTECCDNFSTVTTSAERLPNPIWEAHDDCGYKAQRKGVAGTQYKAFMPVKFGTVPGTVVPALDGVDAIGFSTVDLLATATNNNVSVVQFAYRVDWADVALAVGASPTDPAAWWAMVANLKNVIKTLTF